METNGSINQLVFDELKKFIIESKCIEQELVMTPLKQNDVEIGYSYSCYHSVWLRIKTNMKKIYRVQINPPTSRKKDYLDDLDDYDVKDDQGFISFDIDKDENKLISTLQTLKNKLIETYLFLCENEVVPLTFACCGKYRECSAEKRCLRYYAGNLSVEDMKYGKGCQYRKNLEKGRIFYSKENKNS